MFIRRNILPVISKLNSIVSWSTTNTHIAFIYVYVHDLSLWELPEKKILFHAKLFWSEDECAKKMSFGSWLYLEVIRVGELLTRTLWARRPTLWGIHLAICESRSPLLTNLSSQGIPESTAVYLSISPIYSGNKFKFFDNFKKIKWFVKIQKYIYDFVMMPLFIFTFFFEIKTENSFQSYENVIHRFQAYAILWFFVISCPLSFHCGFPQCKLKVFCLRLRTCREKREDNKWRKIMKFRQVISSLITLSSFFKRHSLDLAKFLSGVKIYWCEMSLLLLTKHFGPQKYLCIWVKPIYISREGVLMMTKYIWYRLQIYVILIIRNSMM